MNISSVDIIDIGSDEDSAVARLGAPGGHYRAHGRLRRRPGEVIAYVQVQSFDCANTAAVRLVALAIAMELMTASAANLVDPSDARKFSKFCFQLTQNVNSSVTVWPRSWRQERWMRTPSRGCCAARWARCPTCTPRWIIPPC